MLPNFLGFSALLFSAYAFLGFIYGSLQLWNERGIFLIDSFTTKIAIAGAIGTSFLYFFQKTKSIGTRHIINISLGVLLLVSASDVVPRAFAFYNNGENARIDLLLLGFILIAIAPLLRRSYSNQSNFCVGLLLSVQLLITISFCCYAAGRLIWSDDHPSFLYRLELLRDHFPYIPFYFQGWNNGYQAREFFATGVLNVFFLASPIIYSINNARGPEDAVYYTYLIPYLFIWIVPWSVFLASRILRYSAAVGSVAGILTLAASVMIFEWALRYGTLAFVLSAGIFPLVFALCYRIAIDERLPRYKDAIFLFVVSSLAIMWSLTALALIPIALIALIHPGHLFAKGRRTKVAFFVLLFLVCNGPWIRIFIRESQVLDFVSQSTMPGADHSVEVVATSNTTPPADSWIVKNFELIKKKGVKRFREGIARSNPLVIFLGIAGLAMIQDRRMRVVFVCTVAYLAAVAFVGDPLKPQLELRRFLLHASFLLCIPAADAVLYFLQQTWVIRERSSMIGRMARTSVQLVIIGMVAMTPLTAHAAYLNRSPEQFRFAPPIVGHLVEAIRNHGGEGVTLFAGFILHELGATNNMAQNGGHVAPLATFTGKHLFASDFIHRKWRSIDPIPASYRNRGPEGIEEFLDLINVTSVITFTRPWAQYCQSQSRYEQVFHEGSFRLFKRSGGPRSFFYRGTGQIINGGKELVVRPGERETVIRFRFLPGMKVSDPQNAEIYPVPAFEEEQAGKDLVPVSFIGIRVSQEFLDSGKPLQIGYHLQRRPTGAGHLAGASPSPTAGGQSVYARATSE